MSVPVHLSLIAFGLIFITAATIINVEPLLNYRAVAELIWLLLVGFGGLLIVVGVASSFKSVRDWGQTHNLRGITLNIFLVVVGTCVALYAVEILTQSYLLPTMRKGQWGTPSIEDEWLGYRLTPYAFGHDANGFRNDFVPEHVDIVAIGDSLTYGYQATQNHAWPQTLSRLTGRPVYNMAVGGYGPTRYWRLSREALALEPDVIVIGLYLGNDLWDTYKSVYSRDVYANFRLDRPELLTDTIASKFETITHDLDAQRFEVRRQVVRSISLWEAIPSWFVIHTAVGQYLHRNGILPAEWFRIIETRVNQNWALASPNLNVLHYKNGQADVNLTPSQRILSLDLTEPRIEEGLRLTKEMMLQIHTDTQAANVEMLILLIATKNSVYATAMQAQGTTNETYARVVP